MEGEASDSLALRFALCGYRQRPGTACILL